jgi:homeobox protein cut-like
VPEKHIHRRNSSQTNGIPGAKKETLEQLLLAKNKKLSSEMVGLRVSHQELQRELEILRETLSQTNADLERAQNLNVTLENDLVTLQQEASNAFPSSAKSTVSRYPTSGGYAASQFASRTRRTSPTSSIISGFDPQGSPFDSMEAIRAGEPVGGGSGILPMVQAQRDRFKQKNSQLEEELSKQYNIVSSLRQEVASLQKDNLSLYEKTRYVSTYNRNQQASSASAYAQSPQSTTIQIPDNGPMDRYKSAYEANISPFAAFRGREAARAYKRMSLPERIVFSITRLVLANRTTRNLFAAYCVALHILVFVMLYWMQTADVAKHAAHLGETVKAAAQAVGNAPGADSHHGDWQQEGLPGGKPV